MIHVAVLAAPFTFSWAGLITLLLMAWLTGGIGICLGNHRLFTVGVGSLPAFAVRVSCDLAGQLSQPSVGLPQL
jgi:fatty-acid desaturase